MMDTIRRPLIRALVGLLLLGAVGGFGAPLSCEARGKGDCRDAWVLATSNALASAGMISALLAKLDGDGSP
jgi:hypothetical protein